MHNIGDGRQAEDVITYARVARKKAFVAEFARPPNDDKDVVAGDCVVVQDGYRKGCDGQLYRQMQCDPRDHMNSWRAHTTASTATSTMIIVCIGRAGMGVDTG